MKDIPNWINRNAYTNIKFITNTGETVEIDRGIDPNFSDIKVNGSQFNLPDKRKVDEFIEDELARIPFPVFCNTISLSFDDFKSFVNLSQADKRKIVDRIFGIDILSDMRTVVKEDLRQSKKDLEIIQSKIDRNLSTLTSSQESLDLLKERLLKKKDDASESLRSQIKEKEEAKDAAREKYASFKAAIDDAQKKIEAIRDENSRTKASISDFGEKLKLYQKNRCPHCLNDLTSDASLKTKEVILNKKNLLEEKLPQLQSSFATLNSELQAIVDQQGVAKSEYYQVDADLKQLSTQLQRALSEVVSDETESIQSIISSIQSDLSKDQEEARCKQEEVTLASSLTLASRRRSLIRSFRLSTYAFGRSRSD
jgi:DNA repair exonuclease SbcCD ATPase subunit